MRVLIAGCGDVGNALGRLLMARGHQVHGLRRDVSRLAPGLLPVRADLTTGAGLDALPQVVDAVVYTAAATERTVPGYQAAYVDGVRHIAERIGPVQNWLFTSSTAVYGQTDGGWVDESSATAPTRFNGQVMLEAEAGVLALGAMSRVVRLGGIYGPGRNRMVTLVRQGQPCVESPPRYTNRIHRDDAAGILAHLLQLDSSASARIWLGVDCEPAPAHVVQDWLAERLGVPPPPRVEAAALPGPGSRRCSNAQLLASGYRFRYPTWREGYGDLLATG